MSVGSVNKGNISGMGSVRPPITSTTPGKLNPTLNAKDINSYIRKLKTNHKKCQ